MQTEHQCCGDNRNSSGETKARKVVMTEADN